jgi:DNA-3-methyladenine glycosylase I
MDVENVTRCDWIEGKPDYYVNYHDNVWGKPEYDDQALFKWLSLEIFHIGLSWQLVLSKYEDFMAAFDDFAYMKVAEYDEEKIEELMTNEKIIRYRRKIEATINNAKQFMKVQEEFGQFSDYIWSFTDGQQIVRETKERVTDSPLSDEVTKDLKRRGFKFVGSVTIYSYLQAIGIVNDHEDKCDFK